MKYSDELNKLIEQVEKMKADEEEKHREEEKKVVEEREKQRAETKKQLVKRIEAAETELSNSYDRLEETKKECKKILEESNAKMKTMLDKAQNDVKQANKVRLDAIADYNKQYGTYTVYYDDAKSNRHLVDAIDALFDPLPFIFWN